MSVDPRKHYPHWFKSDFVNRLFEPAPTLKIPISGRNWGKTQFVKVLKAVQDLEDLREDKSEPRKRDLQRDFLDRDGDVRLKGDPRPMVDFTDLIIKKVDEILAHRRYWDALGYTTAIDEFEELDPAIFDHLPTREANFPVTVYQTAPGPDIWHRFTKEEGMNPDTVTSTASAPAPSAAIYTTAQIESKLAVCRAIYDEICKRVTAVRQDRFKAGEEIARLEKALAAAKERENFGKIYPSRLAVIDDLQRWLSETTEDKRVFCYTGLYPSTKFPVERGFVHGVSSYGAKSKEAVHVAVAAESGTPLASIIK